MVVAGTGHRPDKLGGYGNREFFKYKAVAANWLSNTDEDIDYVISGGALGWDQALAQAAQDLGVPYFLYLPFKGFERKWPKGSQDYLESLMDEALDVQYICEDGYAPWKMQLRNEAMVNDCDTVLALWNGTDGGTANCIRYAEKVGKPIINLWDQFINLWDQYDT